MWAKFAIFILKYRLQLLLVLGLVTAFLAYKAKDAQMTYDFAKVVADDDPDLIYYKRFKETFGEDGNMLVLGMQDSSIYRLENFAHFKTLSDSLSKVPGVKGVLGLPGLIRIAKDTAAGVFVPRKVFLPFPQNQHQLDSLMQEMHKLKFYRGQLINQQTGATLMALTMDPVYLNSSRREQVMDHILRLGADFTSKTNIKLHYAGLPYVRATMSKEVAQEMKLFLLLSVLVTGLTLFFLFRSLYAVIIPLLVILVVVVWGLGALVLLGYKITLLTGLIPSIIVVIGIPNCTYLLTRYHQDYNQHGNKIRALSRIVRKLGLVTLINNTTTAIGFFVFYFTDVAILQEFGLVATINIFSAFLVSIVLIPVLFSYLPPPTPKQLRHLHAKPLTKLLEFFDQVVRRRRGVIYIVTGLIVGIGIVGLTKMRTVSYMVDDLPEESSVNRDLVFFEQHFNGVMPLEVEIDTGRPRGVMSLSNLKRMDAFEKYLSTQPILTPPLSIVGLVKAATQAFYNDDPASYRLPDRTEAPYIMRYLGKQEDRTGLLRSFVDSTGQRARISLKVADVGSRQIDTLLNYNLQPKIQEIFGSDSATVVSVTGTTKLFLKGNDYLINNLGSSLLLAFALVSLVVGLIFKSFRIAFIAIIPNIIPLIITGGMMGFFNIPLKPNTALIFSIALGLAVDDSVHFLAKYRQELTINKLRVSEAISVTLREAGTGMIYTSWVLFFGFVIFVWSDFGGTVALGLLTSITLMIAMVTNLIVLPAILLSFDTGRFSKDSYTVMEHYDEFYLEHEDEAIDLEQLELENQQRNQNNPDA